MALATEGQYKMGKIFGKKLIFEISKNIKVLRCGRSMFETSEFAGKSLWTHEVSRSLVTINISVFEGEIKHVSFTPSVSGHWSAPII